MEALLQLIEAVLSFIKAVLSLMEAVLLPHIEAVLNVKGVGGVQDRLPAMGESAMSLRVALYPSQY